MLKPPSFFFERNNQTMMAAIHHAPESKKEVGADGNAHQTVIQQQGSNLLMEFRRRNFDVVSMDADGNCLFRSVSHQVHGCPEKHLDIRQHVCNMFVQNRSAYKDILGALGGTFDGYIKRMRVPGIWGGEPEIRMVEMIFGRPVEIWESATGPRNTMREGRDNNNPIRITYHGGNHYNSLVSVGPTTPPPPDTETAAFPAVGKDGTMVYYATNEEVPYACEKCTQPCSFLFDGGGCWNCQDFEKMLIDAKEPKELTNMQLLDRLTDTTNASARELALKEARARLAVPAAVATSTQTCLVPTPHYLEECESIPLGPGWALRGKSRAHVQTGLLIEARVNGRHARLVVDAGVPARDKVDGVFLSAFSLPDRACHLHNLARATPRVLLPEPDLLRAQTWLGDEGGCELESVVAGSTTPFPGVPGLNIETFACGEDAVGYGFSHTSTKIKDEYRCETCRGQKKPCRCVNGTCAASGNCCCHKRILTAVRARKKITIKETEHEVIFISNATSGVLAEQESVWKKYKTVVCECTGFPRFQPFPRDMNGRTHLTNIVNTIVKNKDKRWVLFHASNAVPEHNLRMLQRNFMKNNMHIVVLV